MAGDPLEQIERAIRTDPAGRGLISSEDRFGPLCPGHLTAAAGDLARTGRAIAIVTGFFIPRGDPPAAETDGPPGALLLADALHRLGIDVAVITDRWCLPAVRAAARKQAFPDDWVHEWTGYRSGPARWGISPDSPRLRNLLGRLTHLIAIERVGPSHDLGSLAAQPRIGPAPRERFEALVPEAHRDRCHNFRGEIIDEFSGDMHRMFDDVSRMNPGIRRIGIGDGGNEIGMGYIPWEDLERRLPGDHAGWLPCRIYCDWNIIAGTSNWGGYALAAAVLHQRSEAGLLRACDAAQQERVIKAMVQHGPAVDGVTRRREPTVDGLPFETYIQPWMEIRRAVGLE